MLPVPAGVKRGIVADDAASVGTQRNGVARRRIVDALIAGTPEHQKIRRGKGNRVAGLGGLVVAPEGGFGSRRTAPGSPPFPVPSRSSRPAHPDPALEIAIAVVREKNHSGLRRRGGPARDQLEGIIVPVIAVDPRGRSHAAGQGIKTGRRDRPGDVSRVVVGQGPVLHRHARTGREFLVVREHAATVPDPHCHARAGEGERSDGKPVGPGRKGSVQIVGFPVERAAINETGQLADAPVGMDHPQRKAVTLRRFPGEGETLRLAPAESFEDRLTGSRGREIADFAEDGGHAFDRTGRRHAPPRHPVVFREGGDGDAPSPKKGSRTRRRAIDRTVRRRDLDPRPTARSEPKSQNPYGGQHGHHDPAPSSHAGAGIHRRSGLPRGTPEGGHFRETRDQKDRGEAFFWDGSRRRKVTLSPKTGEKNL